MLRVYLSKKEKINSVIDYVDSLSVDSCSFHYEEGGDNVMIIVDGNQSDQLLEYMLPPLSLSAEIAALPINIISAVTKELNDRLIKTQDSKTALDLINNILKTFNASHKALGKITDRDFS